MVQQVRVLAEVGHSILANSRKTKAAGLLVGLRDGSTKLVVSALHCEPEDIVATKELAAALLPPPLAVVGLFGPEGSSYLQADIEQGGVAAGYPPAAAEEERGSGSSADGSAAGGDNCRSVRYSISQGGTLVACQPEVLAAADCTTAGGLLGQLAERYVPVRCSAEVVLTTSGRAGAGCLRPAFAELEEELCGPSAIYVAEVSAADGTAGSTAGTAAGGKAAAAQPVLPGMDPFPALGASWARPAQLRPYRRGAPLDGTGCSAPRLGWAPHEEGLRHSSLCLDVLCYVPVGMPAGEAVGCLVRPAVRRQLRAMRADCEEAAAAGAALMIPNLPPQRALHFQPPGFCHHVTLLYPLPCPSIESEEEALLPRRKALHRLLGLPLNRPLLRVANAADLSGGAGGGAGAAALDAALRLGGVGGKSRLQDVHAGLPAPPVAGSVHLVQGSYDYYHYMQDKFDDSGWGCAYRSLQTICSWFARQQYASRPPPSHREIQAALVSIGDKQAGFIGSKQWIGAIELGFVLDTLLGVSHKVLTVQSGDDMPSLAREIAHHFDTQGTPIMIGGGVLAYTLLGIAFDERTGAAAFLILDPHYTGAEDVRKIQAGQWVAWKQPGDKAAAGGDLFVSSSFYNLLCPQRPATV